MTEFTTWRSLVDGAEISAIPDRKDLHAHYDFSAYNETQTTDFEDLSGNGHDLENGSITGCTGDINGVQAGEFDGVDDAIWASNTPDIWPTSIFVVHRIDDTSDRHHVIQPSSEANYLEWRNTEWSMNIQGDSDVVGSDDDTINLHSLEFNDTSKLRENGQEVGTEDSTSAIQVLDEIGLGSQNPRFDDRFYEGAIGEVLIYQSLRDESTTNDVESYLSDKWNIDLD